jgi:O-antigen/teichoic acid export membrane protein
MLLQLKKGLFSAERSGVVFRTALTSVATRGVTTLASLFTVPLVLHHVGSERYGIWMAAIALSTFFALADCGVTKGLIAEVAKAHGACDRERVRVLIASALAATIAFSLPFLAIALVAVSLVDWAWAFNLSDRRLEREAALVVGIICITFAATYPVTVIREARLGLMQGPEVNLWDLLGAILGFGGLVLAVENGAGLVAIAALWVCGPAIARVVAAIVFLAGRGRDLLPSWRNVDIGVSRALVAGGATFLFYTLTQALALQSDQVLIARFFGAEKVAEYAVVQRLFLQPQVLVTLGLAAQWPAYGEALGRGDFGWISRHLRRSILLYAAFAALACGLLGVFCNPILKIWVGDIAAPPLLVGSMVALGITAAVANVLAFFLMSVGLSRRLLIAQGVLAVVTLPSELVLIPRIGTPGAAIAATFGYLLAYVLPYVFLRDRLLSQLQSGEPSGLAR